MYYIYIFFAHLIFFIKICVFHGVSHLQTYSCKYSGHGKLRMENIHWVHAIFILKFAWAHRYGMEHLKNQEFGIKFIMRENEWH